MLDLHVSISGPSRVLRCLRALFPGASYQLPSGVPIAKISLVVTCDSEGRLWEITQDGTLRYAVSAGSLLAYLEWMINLAAVTHLRSRYLLLHAGAVAYRDSGIVLCAPSGGGKSTLTAGLAAKGFQYLSDEIAAIDPENLMLLPYPRSICVKEGSLPVLMPLYHQLAPSDRQYRFGEEAVWFLQPPVDAWRTNPVPVHYLIFPNYIEGAKTELIEISRSSSVEHLIKQSFTGCKPGEQSIGTIVRLLRGTECFMLVIGDLHEAVGLLKDLVDARSVATA